MQIDGVAHSAVVMGNEAQRGFTSDYNLYRLTGGAHLATWQGERIDTLTDWHFEIGQDLHGLATDPLFVDADGIDDVLGYLPGTSDGTDDNFHLSSTASSYHDGMWAADRVDSPALDAGDVGDVVREDVAQGLPVDDPRHGQHGGRVNLGAYGNTPWASRSPSTLLQILSPNGREKQRVGEDVDITWRGVGEGLSGNVDVAVSYNDGDTFQTIATNQPATGAFTWTPEQFSFAARVRVSDDNNASIADTSDASFTVGPLTNTYYVNDSFDADDDIPDTGEFHWDTSGSVPGTYRVRVRWSTDTRIEDDSDQTFQIVNDGASYYINDTDLAGDQYTTVAGDDANNGKSPDRPMRTLAALLRHYDLDPGDTIFVDSGTYALALAAVIGADDSGVTISGPTNGSAAVLSAETTTVIELRGSTDVRLRYLEIAGGGTGILANGATRLEIADSTIRDFTSTGIVIDEATGGAILRNNVVYTPHTPSAGIDVTGPDVWIEANEVYKQGAPPNVRGDMDGDGDFDFDDITGFSALLEPIPAVDHTSTVLRMSDSAGPWLTFALDQRRPSDRDEVSRSSRPLVAEEASQHIPIRVMRSRYGAIQHGRGELPSVRSAHPRDRGHPSDDDLAAVWADDRDWLGRRSR